MIHEDLQAILNPLTPSGSFPVEAPQKTPAPYIVYRVVFGADGAVLDGDPWHQVARIEITSFGDTYASARTTAEAVRAAMRAWAATVANVCVSELDDFHPEIAKFSVALDYSLIH